MSYTHQQMLGLSGGGVTLYFRPGAVHAVQVRGEKNQRTTVMESGRVVTVNLSPNRVEQIELVFSELQYADVVHGGVTIRGFASIKEWVEATIGYRGTSFSYKPKGTASDQFTTGWQIWDSTLTYQEPNIDRYSFKLTIRRMVLPS